MHLCVLTVKFAGSFFVASSLLCVFSMCLWGVNGLVRLIWLIKLIKCKCSIVWLYNTAIFRGSFKNFLSIIRSPYKKPLSINVPEFMEAKLKYYINLPENLPEFLRNHEVSISLPSQSDDIKFLKIHTISNIRTFFGKILRRFCNVKHNNRFQLLAITISTPLYI